MVEVGKSKKEKLFSKILLALLLIVLVSLFSITFAWFTDKKEYEGTLNFGSIELDVSGGVDNETQTLTFDVSRVSGPTYTGKLMPGDTVNINLTLGLKSTSEPAYYIVYIFDNNGVFEESMYFSEDGTNVYVNNFTKTYLQTDANKASVSDKYCGKLTNESTQNITISAKVSEDYEIQGTNVKVFCKIYAIQQANLTSQQAYDELYPRVNFVTSENWKAAIPDYVNLTSIGFYDKKDSGLTGYAKDDTLTANLDAKLATNDQGKLEVWTKSSTDIAFVSDKVIMAPTNCSYLFSDSTAANRLTNLTSITFNNFNTSLVVYMNGMFLSCQALTGLDLSNFNTSSVTNINSMFAYCSKLTSLDLSNFNTSSVTSIGYMFIYCNALTSLDVSSFNTSSVTSMAYMFYNCSKLTSLDLSNFNTSKVTTWTDMFSGTFSNAPSSSSLKISSNFTYKVGGVNTQFASKTELNSKTALNTSVTVLKDGNALS